VPVRRYRRQWAIHGRRDRQRGKQRAHGLRDVPHPNRNAAANTHRLSKPYANRHRNGGPIGDRFANADGYTDWNDAGDANAVDDQFTDIRKHTDAHSHRNAACNTDADRFSHTRLHINRDIQRNGHGLACVDRDTDAPAANSDAHGQRIINSLLHRDSEPIRHAVRYPHAHTGTADGNAHANSLAQCDSYRNLHADFFPLQHLDSAPIHNPNQIALNDRESQSISIRQRHPTLSQRNIEFQRFADGHCHRHADPPAIADRLGRSP